MGIKGKISFAAFTLGICGVLTATIFCAVERVELSCIVGAVTAAVCCIGCYFGFESWEEEEPEDGASLPGWKEKIGKLFTETPRPEPEDKS